MTWSDISKPDGKTWRRPEWQVDCYIWFSPSEVFHWCKEKGHGVVVDFYLPTREDIEASNWEPGDEDIIPHDYTIHY